MDLTRRIVPLDGVRGIAALMVIVWHLTGSMLDPSLGSLADTVHAATIFGRTGVDLFFVLSGFLIIGIIMDNMKSKNFYFVFYIRRMCRIFPPYFALIIAYWLCFWAIGPTDGFTDRPNALLLLFGQVTFTWNWLMAFANGPVARGFSVVWSVCIEEWFYILFPFLFIRFSHGKVTVFLLKIMVVSILLRAGFAALVHGSDLAVYVLPPFRLDGLCAGGLIAVAVRKDKVMNVLQAYERPIFFLALGLAATVPPAIASISSNLAENMNYWGHSYLTLVASALVLSIVVSQHRYTVLGQRFFQFFGKYSYSLYLFHPLFLSLFFEVAGRDEAIKNWGDAALTLASFLCTVLFCQVLYVLVEKPIRAFGHTFSYGGVVQTNDTRHATVS